MKVDIKTIQVDQELTTEIVFTDYAINKLYIKEGKRKDISSFKKHKDFRKNWLIRNWLLGQDSNLRPID